MYLLYLNEDILAGYGTIDLLRLSLLILIYNLYVSDKIEKNIYKTLEKDLSNFPFNKEDFNNEELKINLVNIGIIVEEIDLFKDENTILNRMKNHVNQRFENLIEILSKDVRILATFPGENAYKHRLGNMYKDDWKFVSLENYQQMYEELHNYIGEKIENIVNLFDERIKFGDVMYENASSLHYQIWSANAVNYNLPEDTKIPGDYQAVEMKIQGPGVYGVITTPRYGY